MAHFILIAVTAATAATIISRFSAAQAVEAVTEDVRISQLDGVGREQTNVVIVGLTEATLDRLRYRSPIDRAFLAELIETIAAQNPRVIGVDIMLDRPTDAASDAALRRVLARFGELVVLAAPPDNGASLSPERRAFWEEFAAVAGHADGGLVLSRRDRTVRVQMPTDAAGRPQSFAAEIAARSGASLPHGELVVPFPDGADGAYPWPFPTYEAHHVLAVPTELGWFRDKVVFIGAVLDNEDRFATPVRLSADGAQTTPGVVIHAYQATQLLEGRIIRHAAPAMAIGLTLVMAALGIAAGVIIMEWGVLTLALTGAAIVHVVSAFALFAGFSVLTPIVPPVLALMFGAAGGATLTANRNAIGRRAIDQAFRHYVAPEVVDAIIAQGEAFTIDGEERDISILVSDIEGFTSMLDAGEPRVIAAALNNYFDTMIDIVVAHGGAVDKIVGDGLIAMFGAPIAQPDHAARAVRCALAIDAAAESFRAAHAALGFGRTRIGVSSGLAMVGSFGGARRINYTAYGSIVNLADRLQSANKTIGTRILISEATRTRAGGLAARPVGALRLRGFLEPELAHEPVLNAEAAAAYLVAHGALTANPLEALRLFEALAQTEPDDMLAAFHARRLNNGGAGEIIV